MLATQHTKKVVSDSPGLVDFAIGLVNFVLNLPDGQLKFFEEFRLQENFEINSAHQKVFGASFNDVWASKCYLQLARMEWQAVKLTFFAPCYISAMHLCNSNLEIRIAGSCCCLQSHNASLYSYVTQP